MDENQIAKTIVNAAMTVHRRLSPGLLESVYEKTLAHELFKCGTQFKTQVPIPINASEG